MYNRTIGYRSGYIPARIRKTLPGVLIKMEAPNFRFVRRILPKERNKIIRSHVIVKKVQQSIKTINLKKEKKKKKYENIYLQMALDQ